MEIKEVCGNCNHYLGGGDWNLCCDVHHPTPMEKSFGLMFLDTKMSQGITTKQTTLNGDAVGE